jgi:hypothetical protein
MSRWLRRGRGEWVDDAAVDSVRGGRIRELSSRSRPVQCGLSRRISRLLNRNRPLPLLTTLRRRHPSYYRLLNPSPCRWHSLPIYRLDLPPLLPNDRLAHPDAFDVVSQSLELFEGVALVEDVHAGVFEKGDGDVFVCTEGVGAEGGVEVRGDGGEAEGEGLFNRSGLKQREDGR